MNALPVALLASAALALPNGQGTLPELGYNSWYMLHSHLVNYTWQPGYVASLDFLDIARFFKTSGLWALGYTMANWDDCVVIGRDPVTHELIPDPQAFPDGPKAVADSLKAIGPFTMGWYTVRGNVTCAGLNKYTPIRRPGSNLFETTDAKSYAAWGVTYLKDGVPTFSALAHSLPSHYLFSSLALSLLHLLLLRLSFAQTRAAGPTCPTPSWALR
jgi:alpha-galactosidase